MTLILTAVVGLFLLAFPRNSPVHPGAAAVVTRAGLESLECAESTPSTSALNAAEPSRTANFSLRGTYYCRQPIFAASERDPFIERLLLHEQGKAKLVAAGVRARLLGSSAPTENSPVQIELTGLDNSELRSKVGVIYANELISALGAGRVLRARAGEGAATGNEQLPKLSIHLNETDASELMSQVDFQWRGQRERL